MHAPFSIRSRLNRLALSTAMFVGCAGLPTLVVAAPADEDHYRLGLNFLQRGMHDLAAKELEAFLKADPKSPNTPTARYALANCLRQTKQLDRAIKELDAALVGGAFEYEADARLLRAQCLFEAGKYAEAAEACEQFSSRFPEHPQMERSQVLRGESLYRAGRFAEAAELLHSPARKAQSPHRPRALLFEALAYFSLGEHSKSADAASLLRGLDSPYKARAALIEAQCRSRLGETATANDRYRDATASDELSVKLDAALGWSAVLRTERKAEEALRVLEQHAGVAKTPTELARVALERARVQCELKDYAAALRTLDLLPQNLDAPLRRQAEHLASRCEVQVGRPEVAAARLQRLATSGDETPDVEVLFDLGLAQAQAKNYEAAAAQFEAVLRSTKDQTLAADALASLAQCQFNLDQAKKSLATCEKYLGEHESHGMAATVRFLRAQCLEQSEEPVKAAQAFADFVEHHADDPRATTARLRQGLSLLRAEDVSTGVALIDAALKSPSVAKEDRVAGLSALANAAMAKSDWATAVQSLQALRELTTDASHARDLSYRIGLCLSQVGEHQKAAREFSLAAEGDHASAQSRQATLELGKSLLAANQIDESRQCLERLVKDGASSDSVSQQACGVLSEIATRQGRTSDALRFLRESKGSGAAASSDVAIQLREGSLLLAHGKHEEAERVLRDLLTRTDTSATAAVEARARLAICLARLGKHEDALAAMNAALGERGLDAGLASALTFERGRTNLALTNVEDAAKDFSTLAKGSPSALGAFACLELARLELNTKPATTAHAKAALGYVDNSVPHSAVATTEKDTIAEQQAYLRGLCQIRLGSPECVETLSKFMEHHPKSPLIASAHYLLGQEFGNRRNWTLASTHLEAAVKLSSEKDARSLAMLLLGNAQSESQQWQAAEGSFSTFLEESPSSELWFQARFGQGWARENVGKHEGAIEAYRDVVARHKGPTAARAQFQIGECLYAMKRFDEAVREYAKVDVLYSYPEWSAAAMYESARCLQELGRSEDARRGYADVVARFADTNWAKLSREQLAAHSPAPLPGRASSDSPEHSPIPTKRNAPARR